MKRKRFLYNGIYISAVAFLNILLNYNNRFMGLYMDDLSCWTLFQEQGLLKFIWNTDAYKFRPVANGVMGIGFWLAGAHTNRLWYVTLFLNFIAAILIGYTAKFVSRNKGQYVPIAASTVYLVSRFAYYATGQYFGAMETLALIFSVLTLLFSFRYLDTQCIIDAFLATIMSILAFYSHERYICLFAVVALSVLLSYSKQNKHQTIGIIGIEIACLLGNWLLRVYMFGDEALAGTGGTNMLDAINIIQIIKFFLCGILYFFGINAGPEYLNGYGVHVPIIAIISTAIVVISFFVLVSVNRIKQIKWKNVLLIIFFIIVTLAVGCTTIRQEMRWLYTPYIGCIMLVVLLYGQVERSFTRDAAGAVLVIAVICTELVVRTGFCRIYFWDLQRTYDSLYVQTVDADSGNFKSQSYVILSERLQDEESKAMINRFFTAYATAMQTPTPEVHIFSSTNDITREIANSQPEIFYDNVTSNPSTYFSSIANITSLSNDWQEVGSDIRNALLLDGFYGWEGSNQDFIWTSQEAMMQIKTGASGKMTLAASLPEFNLPNRLAISFNGKEVEQIQITETEVLVSATITPSTEGVLSLSLETANIPYEVGEGEDRRVIGMCIDDIVME